MADEKIVLSKDELSRIVEGAVQSALENLIKARAQAKEQAPSSKALKVAKKCLGIAGAGLREAGKTLLASGKEIIATVKNSQEASRDSK